MIERRTTPGPAAVASARIWAPTRWKTFASRLRCRFLDAWSSMRSHGRPVGDGEDPRGHRVTSIGLVAECEQVSDEVVELVRSPEFEVWVESEATRLQARLAGLEHRVTHAADSTDACEPQLLDDIAAMLISLRGALEAAFRLRDVSSDQCAVRAAALELVVLRAQDLDAALRTFEARCA